MSEQTIDIDNLNGDELKIAIAIELGYTPNNWPPYSLGDLPDWPTDIAAAWELDGEGWQWRHTEIYLGEDDTTAIGSWIKLPEANHWIFSIVSLSDFPTKAAAYATARCRAWLKAKHD